MADDPFTCLSCGRPVVYVGRQDPVQCDGCGRSYRLAGHLCSNCYTYSDASMPVCTECGEATTRVCGNCDATNWSGDDDCRNCGTSLDILEYLQKRTPQAARERLREQMGSSHRLKRIEEEGSRKRMAELMEIEEERLTELNRRLSRERARDRKMLLAVFGGAAAVLIVVILLIVLG